MHGCCGRLSPLQRHLMSIVCERIPGFTDAIQPGNKAKLPVLQLLLAKYNENTHALRAIAMRDTQFGWQMTHWDSWRVTAHSALPEPSGSIPMGVLIAISQSCRSIRPLIT